MAGPVGARLGRLQAALDHPTPILLAAGDVIAKSAQDRVTRDTGGDGRLRGLKGTAAAVVKATVEGETVVVAPSQGARVIAIVSIVLGKQSWRRGLADGHDAAVKAAQAQLDKATV